MTEPCGKTWQEIADYTWRRQSRTKRVVRWIRSLPEPTQEHLEKLIQKSYEDGIYKRSSHRMDIVHPLMRYRDLARDISYDVTAN